MLLAILPAVAMLPAQAQTVDICDRTVQVRNAILEALETDDCAAVEGLASIESLSIDGLANLQAGDFDGMTGLKDLIMSHGSLLRLPAGVFDDLTDCCI